MEAIGAELDAAIAREVMGIEVLGIAPCSREPECGELEVGALWGEPVDRPVCHVGECRCAEIESEDDEIVLGHDQISLRPVPEYSASIAAAWLVVERLHESGYGWEIVTFRKDWRVALWRNLKLVTSHQCDILPEAICAAALMAARARRADEGEGV